MLENEQDNETERIEKIFDSPRNKSRITITYEYNPVTDLLGKGGYGEVYKVKIIKNSIYQNYYAIKIFDKTNFIKDSDKSSRLLNEIKIHRSLIHEHICKYEHSFEDEKNVYILMEYCGNGTLASFLKSRIRLEEIEIRFYMFQVLLVLKYLRRQKIIHRDLTLGNIFLKDYKTVKIGDFGFAFKEYDPDEKSGVICGTPGYYTPESNICKYSYKTDIFDFGVCIYYLFGGKLPLNNSQQAFDLFDNGELQFEKNGKLSEEAVDLLKNTINVENKRFDLDRIFNHPFFKKGKGLSPDTFPDYNDKDYIEKIHKLTKQFQIKPMINNKLNEKNNDEKKEKKPKNNKKKKKKKNNSSRTSLSSSHSSSYSGKSNKYSSSVSNHSSKKKNINLKNISFNKNRRSLKNSNISPENEKEKENIKSVEEINEENIRKTINNEKKLINIHKAINDPELDPFMKKVLESNYKFYYYYYKNQKKLNKKNIIYITKIILDYRERCGIGYKLNNENIGVIFNDDSQLTKIDNNLKYIFYHEKNTKNILNHLTIKLPPNDISLGLENKIKFLWKIIEEFNLMKSNKEKFIINKTEINRPEEDIFIIKYIKRQKSYFFILSNQSIQVNFNDGVIILFNFIPKGIVYIPNDKKNIISIFPLNYSQSFSEVECEDPVINSKISYAIKEIKK